MIKYFFIACIFLITLQANAFEDCIITTKGKLTDISIENNKIVNVYPLITLFNNKNTLIVEPLKAGKTRFCVLKNGKEKVMFNIEITENNTIIDEVKGFDIKVLDVPHKEFVLDEPPLVLGGQK